MMDITTGYLPTFCMFDGLDGFMRGMEEGYRRAMEGLSCLVVYL